eukprot:TRINITY_DN47669_c0_g1_i1.p1 TRINITY_DN47669_c0_g1~~TRINITY_DN47669_c0_g1_i1.p1  ORF type:complete len:337 (+),score=32.32 TRINITY_DN47669_c0_g1_i1:58-1068(+)
MADIEALRGSVSTVEARIAQIESERCSLMEAHARSLHRLSTERQRTEHCLERLESSTAVAAAKFISSQLCPQNREPDSAHRAYTVLDNFASASHCAQLRDVVSGWQAAGKMRKGMDRSGNAAARTDSLVEPSIDEIRGTAIEHHVRRVDKMVSELAAILRRRDGTIWRASRRSGVMCTVYSRGCRYVRHVDNARMSNARVLTVILYLTESWSSNDGGCLRVYEPWLDWPRWRLRTGDMVEVVSPAHQNLAGKVARVLGAGEGGIRLKFSDPDSQHTVPSDYLCPAGGGIADVEPIEGRLVCFWSDVRCPHAVTPVVGRDRSAITIWYHSDESTGAP